jgi:hypothetical protein
MREAFAQPKMISAIEKMAKVLPDLAEKLADLTTWALENPLLAGGAALAARPLMAGVGGFAGEAGGMMMRKMFGIPAIGAGGAATGGAGGAGAAAAGNNLGVVFQGIAKGGKGLVGNLAKLAPKFAAGAGIAGQAAAAGGLAAAGAAGFALGTAIHDGILDPMAAEDFASWEKASDVASEAQRSLKKETSVEEKMSMLKKVEEQKAVTAEGPGLFTDVVGTFAAAFSDAESPIETTAKKMSELNEAIFEQKRAIREQMAGQLEEQGKLSVEWIEKIHGPMADLNTVMREFKDTIRATAREQRATDATRGPTEVSNPSKPGAEPAAG